MAEPVPLGALIIQESLNLTPQVLLDDINGNGEGDRYRVIITIGRIFYNTLRLGVYKVGQNQYNEEDVFFYAKCVNKNTQPFLYNTLVAQTAQNQRLRLVNQPNLLGIRRPFTHDRTFYSVLIPFMNLGSLRSIMKRRFQYGLPEDLILVALRGTLNGLSAIHRDNQVHGQINAGHIFFNGGENQIKLAFAASVFDLDFDVNQEPGFNSSYRSMDCICEWAAAPEVRTTRYGITRNYTQKADVWMIGVTVLELLYGEIRVKNSEDFNSIAERIINNDRLPRKREGKYLQVKSTKQKFKDGFNKLRGKGNAEIFAEQLGRLVIRCLARTPERRPTVDELLEEGVFRNLAIDLVQFYNEVRE